MTAKYVDTYFKDKTASDEAQIPAASASVKVHKQGATVTNGVTVTTAAGGVAVTVRSKGRIVLGDTVQRGTTSTDNMSVEEVTSETSIKLKSQNGSSIVLAAGDRLVITSNLPTLYNESSGTSTPIANPTTADANGLAKFYSRDLVTDQIVSGSGLTTVLYENVSGGRTGLEFRVTAYGALGDGATNDASAISTTIAAAEASDGVVVFPPSSSEYISSTGGHILKKTTRIFGYGATLKFTSATGTLLSWGNGTLGGEPSGGLYGLTLRGNGGASDTSIGVQLGNGASDLAEDVAIRDCQISHFGNGIVIADGANNQNVIDRCTIQDNAFNGIRFDSTFNQEYTIICNSTIIDNGQSQATGTGIQLGANTRAGISIRNVKLHQNGNGTLAQIDGPATAFTVLRMTDSDIESIDTFERMAIRLLGIDDDRPQVHLTNVVFGDTCSGTITKPLLLFASVDLFITASELGKKVGTTVVPTISIGNSLVNKENFVTLNGVMFFASGTLANAQALAWTGTGGQYSFLSIASSLLSGFDTATNPVSFPTDLRVKHDIVVESGLFKPGAQKVTNLHIMSEGDISRSVDFNTDMLSYYAAGNTEYPLKISYMDGQVGIKAPVVATGSLGGASADRDGIVLIEDTGGGVGAEQCNLILYADGARFRITGTRFA